MQLRAIDDMHLCDAAGFEAGTVTCCAPPL
jgi:hypothetical protein